MDERIVKYQEKWIRHWPIWTVNLEQSVQEEPILTH